jgi:hypothetical protein
MVALKASRKACGEKLALIRERALLSVTPRFRR